MAAPTRHAGADRSQWIDRATASIEPAGQKAELRAFAKRLRIEVREIKVNTRCHWERQQIGTAPYVGAPVAFIMDIDLGAEVPEADQRRLLAAAEKGCFIESSLKPGLVRHRLKLGGTWVDVRSQP